MIRRINIWAELDWLTVFLFLSLVFMGWLNIYAAVYNEKHQSIFDFGQRYGKQMIWIVSAIVLCLAVLLFEPKFYTFLAYPIFIFTIILLAGVVIFGKEVNGARSWYNIMGFQFQPTEFAKVGTCLALSKFLSAYNIKITQLTTFLKAAFIIFLPPLFISLQPDFGSILVYFSLALVLYREGLPGEYLLFALLLAAIFLMALLLQQFTLLIILSALFVLATFFKNKRYYDSSVVLGILSFFFLLLLLLRHYFFPQLSYYFTGLFAAGSSLAVIGVLSILNKLPNILLIIVFFISSIAFSYSVDFVFNHLLKDHQKERVNIFLGKKSDPKKAEYNVIQSKIAIGSGGFFGKGFLQGTQTKYNFVPEQSTDFIFCTVGEEWGFFGSFVVLSFFLAILLRLILLAERQRSVFSRIYGYGVISILSFHIVINVAMTIGLFPVVGIPLPFFSYGGSSLWAFSILLFIFLRIDASRMELLR